MSNGSIRDTIRLALTLNGVALDSLSAAEPSAPPPPPPPPPPPIPNVPPVAAFLYEVTDLAVACEDTSTDSDGTIVSWLWDFGDSSTSTEQSPTHTYAENDLYTVTLTVTDDDGDSSTAIRSVLIPFIPTAPIADFTFTVGADGTAHFTDTSTDDGTITAWAWDFGDGSTSTAQNPTRPYLSAGSYLVTLTVTDNDLLTSVVAHTVTVAAVKILIAIGVNQSNGVGRKFVEQIPTLVPNGTAEQALLVPAFPAVQLWDWEATNAATPVVLYGAPGATKDPTYSQTFGPLAPRPWAMPDSDGNYGIELSLGHDLDAFQPGWFICKFGIGGTGYATNWRKGIPYPATGTELIDQAIARFHDAESAAGARLRCLCSLIGETDGLDATNASNFAANAIATIEYIRAADPAWADLFVVFNKLSSASTVTYASTIRAQFDIIAATLPNCAVVSSEGILLDAGLHFVEYVTLGHRFTAPVLNGIGLRYAPSVAWTYQAHDDRSVDFFDASSDLNAIDVGIASWSWDFGDSSTSTSQNPTHTYAADGPYTVSLTAADGHGKSATLSKTITVATAAGRWYVDGTDGRAYPQSTSEWTAFLGAHSITAKTSGAQGALAAPHHDWNFQVASGAPTDRGSVGGKNLTLGNAPTHQKAVAGTALVGMGGSGTAAKTESAVNATLPGIDTHAVLMLGRLSFAQSAANREVMSHGASGVNSLATAGGATSFRKRTGAKFLNGAQAHAGTGVRSYISARDLSSVDTAASDLEIIRLAWAAASGTTVTFTFQSSAEVTAQTTVVGGSEWIDVTMSEDEQRHLLSALGERVRW